MAELTLNKTSNEYGNGNEGIVITNYVSGLRGGRALDFTGFPDDYIQEGHGIIDDAGVFKPQPIDGSEHAKLIGVCRSLTTKDSPSTGVMTEGEINNNAAKYPMNSASLTAISTGNMSIKNQVD